MPLATSEPDQRYAAVLSQPLSSRRLRLHGRADLPQRTDWLPAVQSESRQ